VNHQKGETGYMPKETARLEGFSDAVFAICITLLILELVQFLHPQSDRKLVDLLAGHWQSFMAFLVGFLTILICWINHHLVFTHIRKTDSNLMWVNGFVLLIITFTPFPTAILAEYIETEGHIALAVFGINYFLMSVAAYTITAYVYNKSLIGEKSRDLIRKLKKLYAVSIVYTLAVVFVCFVSVILAMCLYFLMFIIFSYPKEFSSRLFKKKFMK